MKLRAMMEPCKGKGFWGFLMPMFFASLFFSVPGVANGASVFETVPGALVIAGIDENLDLRLVPAAESVDRHSTCALNFTADREREVVLSYGGDGTRDTSEDLVVGDITVASGATVHLRVKGAIAPGLVHFGHLWLEPGSSLTIDGPGDRALPWAALVTGKNDSAPEAEQVEETRAARLLLDGGSLVMVDGQPLVLYANGVRAASGTPCLRVDGRGGKLILTGENILLAMDASFAGQLDAGKSRPLVAGDIEAEFYRTPRAYSADGKNLEIYLDDASGTPTLSARRL